MKPLVAVFGFIAIVIMMSSCSSTAERTIAPVHWDLNAIIEPTTLRIAGYIGSSSCDAFDSFKVVETDEQVEITVLVSSKQPGPCTSDMRIESINVVLAEPLGERELTGCLPFETPPGEPDLGCRNIVPYP